MAKIDKVKSQAQDKSETPAEMQEKKGSIDFDHPSFEGLTEAAKSFVKKNASQFAFERGQWCVNPAFLKIAGYTEGTDDSSPGFQNSRSKNLRARSWSEKTKDDKEIVCTNEGTPSRINIAAYINDFAKTGYRHGEIFIRYVGGDKITPALWVEGGRHRTVAAVEGNLQWIPFSFINDRVAASISDLRSNVYRNQLSIVSLAEQVYGLFGRTSNGVQYTIEKIAEETGIPVENCKLYVSVMRDIIPEIREAADKGVVNKDGKELSFTTSLKEIAGVLPASKSPENAQRQRDFLASWMKGDIPRIHDWCLQIKRERAAAIPTPSDVADISTENSASEEAGKGRRGRTAIAVFPKLGGISPIDLGYFANGGIPSNLVLDANGIKQLLLSAIGRAEMPDALIQAFEVFPLEDYKKSSAKKTEKAKVEGTAELKNIPQQFLGLNADDIIKMAAERMSQAQVPEITKEPEAPVTTFLDNLDFLKEHGISND